MPVVHVEWLAGRSREQKEELAEAITREMSRIAGCAPAAIQIVFSDVKKSDWAIGGRLTDSLAKG